MGYFSYDLVREKPRNLAKVFVNIFESESCLGAWGWERGPDFAYIVIETNCKLNNKVKSLKEGES
jgi:hypothetical protein